MNLVTTTAKIFSSSSAVGTFVGLPDALVVVGGALLGQVLGQPGVDVQQLQTRLKHEQEMFHSRVYAQAAHNNHIFFVVRVFSTMLVSSVKREYHFMCRSGVEAGSQSRKFVGLHTTRNLHSAPALSPQSRRRPSPTHICGAAPPRLTSVAPPLPDSCPRRRPSPTHVCGAAPP